MNQHSDRLQLANDAAARGAKAWLLVVGLAAEIDALRFPDGFSPVPAPGLSVLVAAADQASAAAALAADRVANLARDPEANDAADTATADALTSAGAAELASRRASQLAFGVSAHLADDDRVERLDRAAVAVLYPPALDPPPWSLAGDEMVLHAKVRPELVVEIAGAICRVLVDRNACLRMAGPADAVVEVSVDGGTTLQVLTNVNPGELDGDWEAAVGGGWVAQWPSPVTVREPAEVIADLLVPHRKMSEGDVTVDASPYMVEVAG